MKLKLIAGTVLVLGIAAMLSVVLRREAPPAPAPRQISAAVPEQVELPPEGGPHSIPAGVAWTPPAADPDVPPVQAVMNPQLAYWTRLVKINELATNSLSAEERDILRGFLVQKDPADVDQSGHVLKNKLMNVLCRLNPVPLEVGDALVAVYRDRSQDDVIRDYALQHLVEFYEQMEVTGVDDGGARRTVQETLWDALEETENGIAGTALLGLQRLSSGRSDFDRARIAKAAFELATSTNELVAITSLQVCGQMRIGAALPLVRQTAQNARSLPLRISAISALGILGNAGDKQLLEQIAGGNDPRLLRPAQRALDRMQQLEAERTAANQ